MREPLPHRYEVGITWSGGSQGVAAARPRPEIAVAPPLQWDGVDDRWSPEHLLLAAAASCLMTTFLSVAAKSKLPVLAYEADAAGVVDKTEAGIMFTSIALRVKLRAPKGEAERGARLLELAKKHCIVSNSLRNPVVLEAEVSEGPAV